MRRSASDKSNRPSRGKKYPRRNRDAGGRFVDLSKLTAGDLERFIKGAKRQLRKEKAKPIVLTAREKKAQDVATTALRKSLSAIGEGRVSVRKSRNGNVTGEFIASPKKGSAQKLLLGIGRKITAPKGVWTSTGFRFDTASANLPKQIIQDYDRKRGSYQTFMHPQAPEKVQTQILRARDVLDHMKSAGHRKPKQVVIRMVWTPKGKRP